MSIFKIDDIIVTESSNQENNKLNLNEITTYKRNDNYSFMSETYRFLLGYTREYNESLKSFYKNILESNNDQTIITESFDGFFDKVSEIIKKFIEFIKNIFAKFVIKMNEIFKSEKYLKQHKNEFAKFTSSDEFTISGYVYTKLTDSNVPLSSAVDCFYKDGGFSSLEDTNIDLDGSEYIYNPDPEVSGETEEQKNARIKTNSAKSEAIVKKIEGVHDKLVDNLDDFYDEFRSKLIGESSGSIDSDSWEDELFMIFRDEASTQSEITIGYTEVSEALRRFLNYNDMVRSIEKTKNEIENNYNKLYKYLENSIKENRSGNKFSFDPTHSNSYISTNMAGLSGVDSKISNQVSTSEINNKLDSYMKTKASQVQQMSSIHTMAFSAKLTAAKDCFVQDKTILYKALSKIQSHKNDH